jgi:hypothetical protein
VTESDNGRLDLVVRSFAITGPPANLQLAPGQTICFGVLRAPGFTDPVQIETVVNGSPVADQAGDAPGQVLPAPCHESSCSVTLVLNTGAKRAYAWFTYSAAA